MTRGFRWMVLVVGVIVLATSVPASACSCAQGDPWTQLKSADAAIIGTLLSKTPSGDWDADYRFRVDEAVKGSFGETVTISSASDGAACGLEVRIGGKTGLFLDGSHRKGWSSSLCQQISPEELRETARPMPEPDGEGPIKMLVGGKWGDIGIVALDSEGRTLAYGLRPGGSTVASVCPGSTRFLEVPWRHENRVVVVRDTSTLEVIERIDMPERRQASRAWCLSESADDFVFASVRYGEPLSKSWVYRVQNGSLELLYEGTASWPELVGDKIYLTEGRYGRRIAVLDLETDDKTFITRGPRYMGGVSVSPDGTKLATAGGGDRETLVSIDMSTSPSTVTTKNHGIGMDGEMRWIDDDTIAYLPSGYDNSKVKVFNADLTLASRLGGSWYTMDETLYGSTAYGMGWGVLYRAPLPEGPAETLREFPTTWLYSLEIVPDEVHSQSP